MSDVATRTDARSSARPGRAARDYRLDFFRGLALFIIFIDHVPDNPLRHVTLGSLALSDAAEVFIFISGYTAALVYGQKMLRDGKLFASALIWRRVWQLYVAHLCLFMLYSAQVAYTVQHFNNPLFSDELGIADFLSHPEETLLRVLLLEFQPAYLDILPLYIFLLLIFPAFMLVMRRHVLLALVPSFLLYVVAQATGLNMPGNADSDGWYFNPFDWQFLFVIAASLGYPGATAWRRVWTQGRIGRWLPVAAGVVTACGLVIQGSWTLHGMYPRVPGILFHALWPIDKSTLAPLRIVSILALVALANRLIAPNAGFLTGRIGWLAVLCGQNSLNVFCLSILLSLSANILLTFVSKTWWIFVSVNVAGILLMVGLGVLTGWYGAGGHLPRRPGAPRQERGALAEAMTGTAE